MARLARFMPVGLPQHIIQRGNNRQPVFACEQDFGFYIHCLKAYSEEFEVSVHAWVLMTNHVHLLVTPNQNEAISKMMQSLGRLYVRYFNKEYNRTGTLWEGRFKSSLVDTDNYLLTCYRYIELNPVRAGMVLDPSEYSWSSYQCNGLGKKSDLLTPHEKYLDLGGSDTSRAKNYRGLLGHDLAAAKVDEIRQSLNKGIALGSKRFKDEIELLYTRRVTPCRMGRPTKNSKE